MIQSMKKQSKQTNPSAPSEKTQPGRQENVAPSPGEQKHPDHPAPPSAWQLQIEEWHEEHYKVTVRKVFSRAGDEAEDLVHEAIARTEVYWDRFDPSYMPFHQWLHGILHHCVQDHFRRIKTKEKYSDPSSFEGAQEFSLDPELPGSDRGNCFQSVLRRVPPKHLELLMAFYGHCQSLKEVARQYRASVGAIKMRFFRAVRALTTALCKAGYRCLDDVEKFGPTRLPLRLIANSSASSKPKLRRCATPKRRSKLLPGSALVRKNRKPKQTIKQK
jgi:RNA polymerase sigma factor (sigma-70 family)